jgi:uncharacterized protein (DUF1800 family)
MLTPLDPKQWDVTKAAHLLNRATFGGTPEDIEALHSLGFEGAVHSVLNSPDDANLFPKPAEVTPINIPAMREQTKMLPEEDRKKKLQEMLKQDRGNMFGLISWWIDRMYRTPNPLREKLTLFWHGHFATSAQKVKQSYLMWQQNEMLRQHALGNFGAMTKAVSRDPAMMIYLDTRQSNKAHPNENFARELMELFTLGIGNYTEDDIKQAARAFTGYKINPQDETFRFAPFQHDDGEKTFFGKTGNFNGDDIIGMILQKPVCAQYIAKKLWEFFAYENPAPGVLMPLADSFRSHNYEIKPVMGEIFRSAEFYSPAAIRTQIKSPVQWLLGTGKILETEPQKGLVSVNALRQMGQVPFGPPSVKGWDGGKAWITTSTLLLRYNLANFALGNGPMNVQPMRAVANNNKSGKPGFDVQNRTPVNFAKIAPQDLRGDPDKLVAHLTWRLFQSKLTSRDTQPFVDFLKQKNNDTSDQTIRDLLHLMMSTPQYQLT